MNRKLPKWFAGLALALVAGAAPLACGGGGGDADMGGAPNDEDETGGTSSTGGNNNDGTGGTTTGGTGGTGEAGGTSTGGTAPTDATIEDLISAICAWEFGCCDTGELTYRLGTAGSSVDECVEFFTFQLNESNTTSNPFVSGSGTALLGTLGYVVNPTRVTENPAGIGECIAEYQNMDCPTEAVTLGYCAAPYLPGTSACSLTNLFEPALEEGERCTFNSGLIEADGNDVECVAGTTCLDAGGDNPEDFPICVQRGTAGDPCTQDNDCDYNFYCNPDGDCTEKGDVGDDCTFNDEANPMPDEEDAGCLAGLKCDPSDFVCVSNCTANYPCEVNTECPEDFVCAPVTISGDADSWKQCLPVGTTASDRCDEDADCAADNYCDGSVCRDDEPIDDPCPSTRNEECESGSFCANNPTDEFGNPVYTYPAYAPSLICTTIRQADQPCFYPSTNPAISTGCGPDAPLCLYDPVDARHECTDALRGEGDDCMDMGTSLPSECEPGLRCEMNGDSEYVCSAGAGLDDACDTAHGDPDELDCGPGLTCKPDVCVAQLDPGEDCEDTENPGAEDDSLCKNGDCVTNWDENGPEFICSDAEVPESNGGDNLTCGGT